MDDDRTALFWFCFGLLVLLAALIVMVGGDLKCTIC